MKLIWKITKAELQTLFFSPLAWLMLVVLGIWVFGVFYEKFDLLVRTKELGESIGHATRMLYIDQHGIYAAILDTLYCFFPLLTMGLISRELSSGSIKLLDSSPVSTWQVVLGKYFSMCIFSLLLVVVLFIPVILGIFTVDNLEMKAIFTGLLGMYLLMCTYSAIGLFMSSLSIYPIVAAVGTFGVLAALNMVGNIWQEYAFMRDITHWLSISSRIVSFLQGIIASADVFYYLLIIALCITLTWLKLRFAKLSWSLWKKGGVYAGVIVVVLFLGYVSSRPAFKFYADGTEDKRNTLTVASQKIMDKVKGKVKITTFVNILHKNSGFSMPRNVNTEYARFEQYTRFHPNMDLEYVYYYGETRFFSQAANIYVPAVGLDSAANQIASIEGLDRSKILTAAEAQKLCSVNLAQEENPVIKIIEIEGKEPRPLRLFEDNQVLPSEAEISAAFKGMTQDLPLIVYLSGHAAPDITSKLRGGYDAMFNTPYIRASFINQGYKVRSVSVSEGKLPENTAVLVIANPLEEYSEGELRLVHEYMERGGNLLLMGDAGNEKVMNAIATPLGLRFAEGYLVEPHPDNEPLPHIAVCSVLPSAFDILPGLRSWIRADYTLPLKMTTTILVDTARCRFDVFPLLASSPNSWLKREKVNLLEGELKPDVSLGEVARPYVTATGLRRQVGDKEQRVVVTADAEWLTNIGLSTGYTGLHPNPGGFASTAMSWLVYHEAPVNTARGWVDDANLNFRDKDLEWIYYLYEWLIPALMVFLGFMFYYRRNKQ